MIILKKKFIGATHANKRGTINNLCMGGSSNLANSSYTDPILTILEFSIWLIEKINEIINNEL